MKRFHSFAKKVVLHYVKHIFALVKKTIIAVSFLYFLFFLFESFRSIQVRQNFHLLKVGMTEEQVTAVVGWPTVGYGYGNKTNPDYLGVWYMAHQPGTSTQYICIFGGYKKLVKAEKGNPEMDNMEYLKVVEKLEILVD